MVDARTYSACRATEHVPRSSSSNWTRNTISCHLRSVSSISARRPAAGEAVCTSRHFSRDCFLVAVTLTDHFHTHIHCVSTLTRHCNPFILVSCTLRAAASRLSMLAFVVNARFVDECHGFYSYYSASHATFASLVHAGFKLPRNTRPSRVPSWVSISCLFDPFRG